MALAKYDAVLVGDNPFLGVSHYSLERARSRPGQITDPRFAAEVLVTALQNGANGFLFSVADTSLSVARHASRRRDCPQFGLYAIVPYSFEFVRLAVSHGGLPGLASIVARRLVGSANVPALVSGLRAAVSTDPAALCEAYVRYDIGRVRAAVRPPAELRSVLLHEIVTDMALGLGWDWLFREFLRVGRELGLQPGFNTRNLAMLLARFREWRIATDGIAFLAPFNPVGFQMCPSRETCEQALATVENGFVIGFSLLAAGYVSPREAAAYAASLRGLRGVSLGVSRLEHAAEVFRLFGDAPPAPERLSA